MAACIASILELEGIPGGREVHKLCGKCVKVHLGIYVVLLNITALLESFLELFTLGGLLTANLPALYSSLHSFKTIKIQVMSI